MNSSLGQSKRILQLQSAPDGAHLGKLQKAFFVIGPKHGLFVCSYKLIPISLACRALVNPHSRAFRAELKEKT